MMSDQQPGTKYTLKDLMIFTGIIALSLAPVSAFGGQWAWLSLLVFVGSLLLWFKKCTLATTALFVLFVIGLLLPALSTTREVAKRSTCRNNIKHLTLAILNYESANGKFPPPYTTDANGEPLHSWRVLILPYLGQQKLYDDLDLTMHWDHPDNLKHAHRMPEIFRCPSYKLDPKKLFDDVMTSYVAVVGAETVWNPDAGGVAVQSIADGLSNTILLIESDTNRAHWMSPLDLRFEEIVPLDNSGRSNVLRNHHDDGQISFCDGHIAVAPKDAPAKSIRETATIAGREVVSLEDW